MIMNANDSTMQHCERIVLSIHCPLFEVWNISAFAPRPVFHSLALDGSRVPEETAFTTVVRITGAGRNPENTAGSLCFFCVFFDSPFCWSDGFSGLPRGARLVLGIGPGRFGGDS